MVRTSQCHAGYLQVTQLYQFQGFVRYYSQEEWQSKNQRKGGDDITFNKSIIDHGMYNTVYVLHCLWSLFTPVVCAMVKLYFRHCS